MRISNIAISLAISTVAAAFSVAAIAISTSAPHRAAASPPTPATVAAGRVKPLLDLDCNRPQGHHVWTGDMITPDGDTLRVSNGDEHEDVDVHGWLCVIAPHLPKTD